MAAVEMDPLVAALMKQYDIVGRVRGGAGQAMTNGRALAQGTVLFSKVMGLRPPDLQAYLLEHPVSAVALRGLVAFAQQQMLLNTRKESQRLRLERLEQAQDWLIEGWLKQKEADPPLTRAARGVPQFKKTTFAAAAVAELKKTFAMTRSAEFLAEKWLHPERIGRYLKKRR